MASTFQLMQMSVTILACRMKLGNLPAKKKVIEDAAHR
jgi:hypothetical protein